MDAGGEDEAALPTIDMEDEVSLVVAELAPSDGSKVSLAD